MGAACLAPMVLAGFALAGLGAAAPGNAGEHVPPPEFTDPERRAKLERAFPELEAIARRAAEARGFPGLAWGVVIDGELARFGSVGLRDVDRRLPIDADTVFRIASMTKSFTALAILMLRDEGRLELDAPASRYLPELAALAPPTRDSGPITVRHLLTHTAGFPEDNPWGDRQLAVPDARLSQWLSAGIPFSRATGSAYEYSNYGFALLGRIVANVSGTSHSAFVKSRILDPLGMKSSTFEVREVPAERLAVGYRRQDERYLAEVPLGDGAFGAMGGLLTSSRDLARWIGWMLAAWPPRDDAESPPALRRSVREMQQGAGPPGLLLRRASFGAPLEAQASVYGFGLGAARSCDAGPIVGHSGGLPGWGSYMLWLPEHGVGLFAMANLTYAGTGPVVREMLAALERTGGLEPRRAQPAPALREATRRLAGLLDDWDDATARALAADNLFLDEPLERRRAAITALREGLGRCSGGPVEAENALRGSFRMRCEHGWLQVRFTLAPTQPPAVQQLEVAGGRAISPGMQTSLEAVLEALVRGPQSLDLAAAADRDAIGTLLLTARERYGACRLGEAQEGDGERSARVRLACDRGPLDLTVSRKTSGRIMAVQLAPPPGVACMP